MNKRIVQEKILDELPTIMIMGIPSTLLIDPNGTITFSRLN
ncbi:hypothetical protein [Mucilaginibacter paludis]|nr:hypothetical protein [Mucilaginibacter paludis]